jgi:hypothetical protein
MNNLDIWPGACQTLGNETPVTALRGGLVIHDESNSARMTILSTCLGFIGR